MSTIQIDRISKDAFDINQIIVNALQDTLNEYKSDKLTARFITLLKKRLPEGQFNCWMAYEKRFCWYVLRVEPENISRFYVDEAAPFRKDREGKDFYAVRLNEQITVKDYSGHDVDWREKFQFAIDRFNEIDCYEWEQNREAYLEQFAALEQQAMEIKAKADALLESIPKPEHDPLNRWRHKSDYTLQQAFPHAFHYYERR